MGKKSENTVRQIQIKANSKKKVLEVFSHAILLCPKNFPLTRVPVAGGRFKISWFI